MARSRISGQQAYKNFEETFRSAYRRSAGLLEKTAQRQSVPSIAADSAARALGHPEYIQLRPGETREATAVVSFVDIRGFTKMSLALEAADLLRIVQALTEASIRVITDGGGYIGEFTGDGVMAYFGDAQSTDDETTTSALETTSLLFKTVDEIVNPELKSEGIDPIRIAAGMEFGKVLWSRVGMGQTSQVKPIATATFLAGKLCSGNWTDPWECKIGSELAEWVPDEYKTKAKQYGPFTVKGKQVSREIYLLDWRALATEALLNQAKLEENIRKRRKMFPAGLAALPATKIAEPLKPGTPGPRPLKDQPFFGE